MRHLWLFYLICLSCVHQRVRPLVVGTGWRLVESNLQLIGITKLLMKHFGFRLLQRLLIHFRLLLNRRNCPFFQVRLVQILLVLRCIQLVVILVCYLVEHCRRDGCLRLFGFIRESYFSLLVLLVDCVVGKLGDLRWLQGIPFRTDVELLFGSCFFWLVLLLKLVRCPVRVVVCVSFKISVCFAPKPNTIRALPHLRRAVLPKMLFAGILMRHRMRTSN